MAWERMRRKKREKENTNSSEKNDKTFKKRKRKNKGGGVGVWNNKQKESAMLFKWQEQSIKTRNCSRIRTDKQNNLNSVRRNKNVTVV
jgi:hypothetical protein